jgi:CheY-like chemotaxis protein
VTGAIRFEVNDTGCGIALEAQERLFEKFTQADSSISRRHGGSGLGLAICRELVELMHGKIGVTSETGRGSCFWFEIPTGAVAGNPAPVQPAQVPAATLSSSNRKLNVLVAEDNAINQQVVRAMLVRAGHTVKIVADGEEAVAAVKQDHFDIVLMDIQMPVLDGLGATRQIRAMEPPKGRIPIVALTADAMTGAREHYIKAGMDGYLAKPMRFRELMEIVQALALEPLSAAS